MNRLTDPAMSPASPLPPLSGDATQPLYRQVYERFRLGIVQGLLAPGDRIPSARALAQELGVARGTVELAYSLLNAEGYVQSRGQAGTVVAPGLHSLQRVPKAAAAAPSPARIETARGHDVKAQDGGWVLQPESVLPLQMGLPALDAFPRKIWARLGARHLRATQIPGLGYPPPGGLPALRQAIAAYLQMARGIQCLPSQVFVTSGLRSSLLLATQALLVPGQRVWTEDPGYPPTRQLLTHLGLHCVPVPVDGEGLMVHRGLALDEHAKAAVVTPAHQSPLSMSLSLPRRQALLEWASRREAWIVEDDYDGEYRYASRPLPALKSLDRDGRVLYAGTFSKVLIPALRMAYLVVPETQVPRFEQVAQVCGSGAPTLTQEIVASFMAEGHFVRHIQRMRRLYADRRETAVAAFSGILSPHMRIEPQPGGMHLILRMAGHHTDRSLVARMRAGGLYAQALSRWSIDTPPESAVLVSFTNIATAEQAEAHARHILALLPQQP
ncbi:GntR family transcriptional regulator/MocR family aminotransferase [Comamonas sp. BIGb0124]|uniref:MocR-like pyridoxine biosynthesis transcription factor PdxR n=1 Tax=Comamonas sp. BIGb0124 TaxID=2485130 RepID=UPI000FA24EA0|nr:PLP-dependent aminotransferase family protein [Comamonas sp. BIGb0124]ROR17182.1 GntR family transcriptional regulator/MocR family aminotransferase [Comamonas sp. BIGb0124]